MKYVMHIHKSTYHNGFLEETRSQLNNGINNDKSQGIVQYHKDLTLVIPFHDMPFLCQKHF